MIKIKISEGNSKLSFPNLSFPPIKTCRDAAPCIKDCYAMKSYRMYDNVRNAWNQNLDSWNDSAGNFFDQLNGYLTQRNPEYFRYFVAGDIPDAGFFNMMLGCAMLNPDTKFLAFTKQYEIVNYLLGLGAVVPKNLTLIFSQWPGLVLDNPHDFPVAYLAGEDVPLDAFLCVEKCDRCCYCWRLTSGESVVFGKH